MLEERTFSEISRAPTNMIRAEREPQNKQLMVHFFLVVDTFSLWW